MQYASGRYFTLIYTPSGVIQWERGHTTLVEASERYGRLLADLAEGRLDPAQPHRETGGLPARIAFDSAVDDYWTLEQRGDGYARLRSLD
jgi:hypothetical protein